MVYIESSAPFINNCTIKNSSKNGIYIAQGGLKIKNSDISNNIYRGIYINNYPSGQLVNVEYNTISNNFQGGVYAYFYSGVGKGTFSWNTISKNSGNGIHIPSADPQKLTISDNLIEGNNTTQNGGGILSGSGGCTGGEILRNIIISDTTPPSSTTSTTTSTTTTTPTATTIPQATTTSPITTTTTIMPPTISLSPTSLSFSAQRGGSNPASQTVSVANTGGGTLSWTASVSSGAPWLSISPTSGTAPSSITVLANISGMPEGTHNYHNHISNRGYKYSTDHLCNPCHNRATIVNHIMQCFPYRSYLWQPRSCRRGHIPCPCRLCGYNLHSPPG